MKTEQERIEAIIEEAKRMELWARAWDKAYRDDALRWSHINLWLVVGAGLLAALAATTGLTKYFTAVGAGVLALAAAALSAVATALRPAMIASEFNTAAAANSGLADTALVFRTTLADHVPIDEATSEFRKLCERRDGVVNNAPVSRAPWRRRRTPTERPSAWPPCQGHE